MNRRPPSASNFFVNCAGVAGYSLAVLAVINYAPHIGGLAFAAVALSAAIIPIVVLEVVVLKVHKRIKLVKRLRDNERIRTKTTGLYGTLLIIGLGYAIFPEYEKSFYLLYLKFITYLVLIIFSVGWIYIDVSDAWWGGKEDGMWHMGCALKGHWGKVDKRILAEYWRGWLIKAYFLPVMFSFFAAFYKEFWEGKYMLAPFYVGAETPGNSFLLNHRAFHDLGINDMLQVAIFFVITVDVLFATIGYLMTFKGLDADIKSSDPTLAGWFVCLMCYPPFWAGVFYPSYLAYAGAPDWRTWLGNYPVAFFCWGMLVLLTQCVNTFTTVSMGIRFSNLTYRGLITTGFFRFTKHPQYIAKALNWLLISMPFLSLNGGVAAIHSVMLLMLVWGVYYLRARTEENHLSRYPEYAAYARWINEHGIFRGIAEAFPYLRYSQKQVEASVTK